MIFQLSEVSYAYSQGDPVLKQINLKISPERVTGIAGPNGAGKSTLMRLLARILSPVEGTIHFRDKSQNDIPARVYARAVAWVPQELAFPFPLSVEEVVSLGRYACLKPFSPFTRQDKQAVEKALEELQLSGLKKKSIQNLSGGERKRVLLARAMAAEPDVYLLDEPFAHLDPLHQGETAQRIRGLHVEGRTVVVISHQINFLLRTCDEIVLLKNGSIFHHLDNPSKYTDASVWETLFDSPFELLEGPKGPTIFPEIPSLESR